MRSLLFALALSLALSPPAPATAQFEEPCEVTCAGVLGATAFVAATGTAVAVGRFSGGMSTVDEGLFIWGGTFTAVVGAGIALSGDGERQERAVYAAGIGTLGGALVGLALEAIRTDGDGPRVLAGTLIGATVGALAGGVYGALSHDPDDPRGPGTLLSVSIPF